jgi:hypothetical protein
MKRLAIVLFTCTSFFAGCRGVEVRAPDGFVVYTKLTGPEYRAISAEGIALRVKRAANEPASDVALWSKALKLNLESRGYVIRSEEPIQTGSGLRGSLLKTASKVGNQDYGYFCALFVVERDLFFVEAAGAYPEFAAREAQILDAMRTFKPKPGLL